MIQIVHILDQQMKVKKKKTKLLVKNLKLICATKKQLKEKRFPMTNYYLMEENIMDNLKTRIELIADMFEKRVKKSFFSYLSGLEGDTQEDLDTFSKNWTSVIEETNTFGKFLKVMKAIIIASELSIYEKLIKKISAEILDKHHHYETCLSEMISKELLVFLDSLYYAIETSNNNIKTILDKCFTKQLIIGFKRELDCRYKESIGILNAKHIKERKNFIKADPHVLTCLEKEQIKDFEDLEKCFEIEYDDLDNIAAD